MIVREGQIWRKISDVKSYHNLSLVECDIDYQVISEIDAIVKIKRTKDKSFYNYDLDKFEDDFIYIFTPGEKEEEQKPKNKYHRDLKGVTVDVYDVLKAFEVTDPALQHLIKKALCAGLRGHKNKDQDLQDILDSAKRAVELNSL